MGSLSAFKMPYFIKPAYDVKLFTGELITNQSQINFLYDYYEIYNDTVILLSDPIDIVSEYRCFVHEDELKGIQYYLGDFTVYPNTEYIKEMISSYMSPNCAYTLDVGITTSGETLLIEVNDMWAIGSYGMDAKTYALMCVRRMREIGRQANGERESLWKRLKQR